jgi:endoglucanase
MKLRMLSRTFCVITLCSPLLAGLSGCAGEPSLPEQTAAKQNPAQQETVKPNVRPATATGLRHAFAPYFLLGTALSQAQISGAESSIQPLLAQHFNSLTAANLMKWENIEPVEGQFDFSGSDALLQLAKAQGSVVIGHTLLWHEQTPAWVFSGPDGQPASKALLLERLSRHIQTVVGRYRGQIKGWDVVNEALNEDGSLRNSKWRQILGDDYILTAFRLAQEADPAVELYYNDFNLYKPEKRQGVLRLVKQLQDAGIRVAGIGMQGHYGLDSPALNEVEDSIRAYAATGAQVMITELDISVLPWPEQVAGGADISHKLALEQKLNPYVAGLPAEVALQLTKRYVDLFRLFLKYQASINRVTLWGVHDAESWRNNFPMLGRTDYPLLFDRQQQAKPAVAALMQLTEQISTTCAVVQVNQTGYLPSASKQALVQGATAPQQFRIFDASGAVVFAGQSSAPAAWALAAEKVATLDFSALQQPGFYQLQLHSDCPLTPFRVAPAVYSAVHDGAIKAFYFNRASTALDAAHAGPYARAAGHPDDQVIVHTSAASVSRPAGTQFSAPKGWYDAGDYNKYVVNSGVSTYTLLQAYSDFPAFYANRQWQIPESGLGSAKNAMPDLLDEVSWNLDWLRAMQDPFDGGVYHKLTNLTFDGVVMPKDANKPRFVVQKTTAAALNYAAVMAKASRVLAAFPADRAQAANYAKRAADYAQSAEAAWRWALAHPDLVYRQPADVKTGAYGDEVLSDEFAFAAGALYLQNGRAEYLAAFDTFWQKAGPLQVAGWANPLALVVAELAATPTVPAALRAKLQQQMSGLANEFVRQQQQSPAALALVESDFVWGSNAVALNKAMLLLQSARLLGTDAAGKIQQQQYQQAAQGLVDYVLGRNPTGYSYVSGFGNKTPQHLHHRPSEADGVTAPVLGWLAGGANPGQQDGCVYPSKAPAKSYSDTECSYASNEVAINWNAPLVYVLAALLN